MAGLFDSSKARAAAAKQRMSELQKDGLADDDGDSDLGWLDPVLGGVGAIAGGIGGFMVGGPPGAVAGATGGYSAGTGLSTAIQGVDEGDYGQATSGAIDAGLAVAGTVAGMPSTSGDVAAGAKKAAKGVGDLAGADDDGDILAAFKSGMRG
jgi:hypothetical protein